jgi:hypothetical protein
MSQMKKSYVPSQVEKELGETLSAFNASNWENAQASLDALDHNAKLAKNDAEAFSPGILFPKWVEFLKLIDQIRDSLQTITELNLGVLIHKQSSTAYWFNEDADHSACRAQCAAMLIDGIQLMVQQEILPSLLRLYMIKGEIQSPLQLNFTQKKS